MSRYRFGFLLTLAGGFLVVVAFFSPWFDVFKLNDPSFYFPKRGYSPWMVVARGQPGSLAVVAWVFLILTLTIVLGSLALLLARTTHSRSIVAVIVRALAVLSLVMTIMIVPMVPYGLSFSWPYLSATPSYGIVLAIAGFVGVLIGLTRIPGAILSPQ